MSTWDMITTYPQVSFWLGSVMCETWHFRQSQTVHSPLTRKTIFMDLILSPYPYHIWTITHVPFANLDYQVENSQFFPSPNLWTNKRNQYPNKMRISLLQSPFLLVELPFVSFLSPTKKNNASNPKYMNLRIKHQTSWKKIVFFFPVCFSQRNIKKRPLVSVHGHPHVHTVHTLAISRSGCHALSTALGNTEAFWRCCASCSGREQLPPGDVSTELANCGWVGEKSI